MFIHHHPSPVRHSPDRRTRAITRSAVLTAVMRLPWRDVVGRVRDAWQAGGPRRAGARDALGDLAAALRARRPVPPEVLELLKLLDDDAPAPRPADGRAVVAERGTPAQASTTEGARVGAGSYGGDV